MQQIGAQVKSAMEDLISAEIRRLMSNADVYIFALYDPNSATADLVDYQLVHREEIRRRPPAVTFKFEGVGVWYICRRTGDTFTVRHIVAHIQNGRFINGQVGTFEGYWDEFPRYIAQDRWIKSFCKRRTANDR